MKRFSAVILAVLLLLCSCKKDGQDGLYRSFNEHSDAVHTNGYSDAQTMLTVDGYNIPYSEFRYYFLNERNHNTDWESMTDAQKRAWVADTVVPDLLFSRAIASLAQEHGICLDKDEQNAARDYISRAKDELGDTLEKTLSALYMTDDLYDFLIMQGQLAADLLNYYQDETTSPVKADDTTILNAEQNGDMVRVKHILIRNDPDEAPSDNLAIAEQLLAQLEAGADFDALMQEYSEDPGLENESDGYYMFRYEMDEAFEDAAFSLQPGQTSGVVAVNADGYSGYHIIRRESADPEYLSSHINTLRKNYMATCFYRDTYARIPALTVSYTDAFNNLDPDTVD